MFLKMPVLESKIITLRTEHHQAQNSSRAAGDKMTDPHTKHLSDIISPTQQRVYWNRLYITAAKQWCPGIKFLSTKGLTFILPHQLSMSSISILQEVSFLPGFSSSLPCPTWDLAVTARRREMLEWASLTSFVLWYLHSLQWCLLNTQKLTKQVDSSYAQQEALQTLVQH